MHSLRKSVWPDRWQTRALLLILLATAALWIHSANQRRTYLGELVDVAARLEHENQGDGFEVTSSVNVARSYVLFGQPFAIIEVYSRSTTVDDPPIQSIEYRYVKEAGEWTMTDSGFCSDEACQIRGGRAFQARLPQT